jgi:hypothetical protein
LIRNEGDEELEDDDEDNDDDEYELVDEDGDIEFKVACFVFIVV